ncbi:MAG: acyltransferase domain-containing protein, partial [Deltaproteobacteria bacterium]|nr:acyltransferase domain-containing protein [Deltaproteobacteria bacterium]
PTIKVEQPNPALEIEHSPFHLSTEARPWVRDARFPRRASVSSFGFGGSNFHVAMSEYVPADGIASRPAPKLRAFDCELVTLSGEHARELVSRAKSYAAESSKPGFLQWLARTSQAEFDAAAPMRLAIVASDEADLAAKLEQAAKRIESGPAQSFSTPTGILFGSGRGLCEGGLAYLFSGQGSQYLHMGASLAMQFGSALGPWDRAANFEWDGTTRLHHVVFPRTAFDDESKAEQERTLAATEWAQPAIGCTSLSLLKLLDGLGLQADCFAGHSFGEVTALHAAGVLSLEDFLAVARRRGELMAEAAVNPGAMIAIAQPIERIRSLLEGWDTPVVIANHNAPEQVVLSGEASEIEKIEKKLDEQQIKARRLPVATAFHSPVVEKASGAFGEYLADVVFSAPVKPVYSNTTGIAHDASPTLLRSKLAEQLASPVKFVDMIEAMYKAGVRSFVEVGPGSVLSGLVGRILEDRPHVAVNLDRKGRTGIRCFFEALARLSVEGYSLDFASLWSEFAEPENPMDRVEPKLRVPISGTNYGKPYPPLGGAAELPAPNPPRKIEKQVETVYVEVPRSEPEAAATPMPTPGAPPVQAAPLAPAIQAAPGIQSAAPAPLNPGWAEAYQDAQRQTAEAHIAYMQAMAQTHTAYLETIDRSFQSLSGQVGLEPVVSAVPLTSPPAQAVTPAMPIAQLAHQPVVTPLQAPAVAAPMVPVAPLASQPIAPPAVAPEPAPAQSAAQPQAGNSDIDLHALLLEVVSEKTGYPTEMLTMEMELEADLGIDSIKRVEILSAMDDVAPGLQEVDVAVMAKLATLGEVVDFMNEQLAAAGAPAAPLTAPSAPSILVPTSPIDLHT